MAIYYPPIFINAFLADKVPSSIPNRFASSLKFFPTMPTDIQQLTEQFPEAAGDVFAVYDRMFKMRRGPFPHIKSEQLLYYFYKMAGDPAALIETTQLVLDLLDTGDESAQSLNEWIKDYQSQNPGTPAVATDGGKPVLIQQVDGNGNLVFDVDGNPVMVSKLLKTARIGNEDFLLPFFHSVKVYQLEETRDIIDFGTARTYAGNKIIIDYDWHKSQ